MIPKISIITSISPVWQLKALAETFDHNDLWIKSEGQLGDLYGGNKVRNLEFLIADAQRQNRDTLVCFGSIESNFAIAASLYGIANGLKVKLYLCNLSKSKNEILTPYIEKLKSLSAEVHIVSNITCFTLEWLSRISATLFFSKNEYAVPFGGASPVGCVGQYYAALELHSQIQNGHLPNPELLFVPVGSGGTIAGLIAGFSSVKSSIRIIGINTSKKISKNRILNLSKHIFEIVNGGEKLEFSPIEFELLDNYKGSGYGKSTYQSINVAKLVLEKEGVFLDHTYTAKSMCAFYEYSKSNKKPILFWYTYNSIQTK